MLAPVRHLYIHIPFCPAKCEYCAFVTHVGSLKLVQPYLEAIRREADRLAALRHGGRLETVYFGGGTPSLLRPEQVEELIRHASELWGLAPDCEITLEAHPATVSAEQLMGFRQAGVTRLSFGGESLDGNELRRLGRRHGPERVLEMLELSRAAGFDNMSLDFMYGLPGQTLQTWKHTLRAALAAGPDHLSLYPLSIEPRTGFGRKWKQRTLSVPEDGVVADMYAEAVTTLREAGYVHYEVASWSRPGRQCRHNLAYWHNREFYALGVGAHGYLKPYRTENERHTRRYIDRMLAGEDAVEARVHVDRAAELSETIMLRLRLLQEGASLGQLGREYQMDLLNRFAPDMEELERHGLVRVKGDRVFLREDAVPLGNEVWQRFMVQ